MMLFIPRVANYDMVVLLTPWFVTRHTPGSLAPRARAVTDAVLGLLLVGVGLLAYRDHALVEMPIFALVLPALLWLLRPARVPDPVAPAQTSPSPAALTQAAS